MKLSRRAMRNEIRTLTAQLTAADNDRTRLRELDNTNQEEIARLQRLVTQLRHLRGRKDLDLVTFIRNAHTTEMAEHRAEQAEAELAEMVAKVEALSKRIATSLGGHAA